MTQAPLEERTLDPLPMTKRVEPQLSLAEEIRSVLEDHGYHIYRSDNPTTFYQNEDSTDPSKYLLNNSNGRLVHVAGKRDGSLESARNKVLEERGLQSPRSFKTYEKRHTGY